MQLILLDFENLHMDSAFFIDFNSYKILCSLFSFEILTLSRNSGNFLEITLDIDSFCSSAFFSFEKAPN